MKQIFILVLLLITGVSYSQSADEIIGKLMNEQKMFELRQKHNELAAQSSPMINYFAQAMLAQSFNNPQNGIIVIDTLLNNQIYQQQLGIANIAYLIYLKNDFLETLFQYQESVEMLESFLTQTKDMPIDGNLRLSMQNSLRINKTIADLPATTIERPQEDVQINFISKRAGKGISINIPCEINGSEAIMCFDTGNPKYSVVSRKFAKQHNIRSIVDSIPMQGVGIGMANIGIADSLIIGDIKCYNSLFYIVDKISPIDTIPIDAVLGSEILNAIGEIRILPLEKKMIFSAEASKLNLAECNMIMNNRHLFVSLNHNSKNILMHFDTGSSQSNMSKSYFNNNKENIENTAIKDSINIAGFGGVSRQIAYKQPKLSFDINNVPFDLNNISIHTEDVLTQWNESGCLGADFVLQFEEVIINYKNMFIKIK